MRYLFIWVMVWAASSLAAQPTITPPFGNNATINVYDTISFQSTSSLGDDDGNDLTSATAAPLIRFREGNADGDSVSYTVEFEIVARASTIRVIPAPDTYLDWNTTYYIRLDSTRAANNGTKAAPVERFFTTAPKDSIEVESLTFDPSANDEGKVSPYQDGKTLLVEFNNYGVEDHADDNVVIDGVDDFDVGYQDNAILITFKTTLDYATTYPIYFVNLKSAEPKLHISDTTETSFTTIDPPIPSLTETSSTGSPSEGKELCIPYNRNIKIIDETKVSVTPALLSSSGDPTFSFEAESSCLVIKLAENTSFDYRTEYVFEIDSIAGDETILVTDENTDTYTFRTGAPIAPAIESITDVRDITNFNNNRLTPYQQVFTIDFGEVGVKANGGNESVEISNFEPNTGYSFDYSDNKLVISFANPLEFDSTYVVNLYNIQANEIPSNEAENLSFSFTTTDEPPSITNLTNSGETICANQPSPPISFRILEGHRANFHSNQTNESMDLRIRKVGSDKPSDYFIFNRGSSAQIPNGRPTDLGSVSINRPSRNGNRILRLSYNSNTVGFDRNDIIDVSNVTVQYNRADGVLSGEGGTYEIYIESRQNSYRGLPEVIATVILEGSDSAPNLVRTDSRSGEENRACKDEPITFYIAEADSASNFNYYVNDTLAHTGFSYITDTLKQLDQVYASTTSICATNSDTLTIDSLFNINPDSILFKAAYEDGGNDRDIRNGSRTPIGNITEPLILTAQYADNGELVALEGEFYDTYNYEFPLLYQDENENYRWSAVNAWRINPNPALYNVFFQHKCALRDSEDGTGFEFSVYDQGSADQLKSTAITRGTICDNQEDSASIDWIPGLVLGETIAGYTISSPTAGLITSDSNRYYIHPDAALNKRVVSINIDYLVYVDSTTTDPKRIEQGLSVAPPAEVKINDSKTGQLMESAYCSLDEDVDLTLSSTDLPKVDVYYVQNLDSINGQFLELETDVLRFDQIPNTLTTLDSANYLPPNENGYNVRVEYRTEYNCASTFDALVLVNELPPAIEEKTIAACVGTGIDGFIAPIDFTPTDVDSARTHSLIWSLNNIERENGWIHDTQISDSRVGSTTLNIQLLDTLTGCVSEKSNVVINVGELPEADFEYEITSDQKLWLTDTSTTANREEDQIATWYWKTDHSQDELLRTAPITNGYDTLPLSGGGIDTLSLVVTTNLGCSDTSRQAITMPVYADQSNDSYTTSFEGEHGWIPTTQNENTSSETARNSTWELKEYKGVTNAWHAAGNNEYSWVESPLIDISQWTAPVLSMDLNYDTPELEGLVIQYRVIGETPEQNSQWEIVGSTETGAIPYNSSGISARPGDGIVGWAGQSDGYYDGWLRPAFELSNVRIAARDVAEAAGRPTDSDLYVQFRMAYATLDIAEVDDREGGVSFANFTIYNKSHKVLIEHYTNLNMDKFSEERVRVNEFVEDRYNNTDDPDIVYLQVHSPVEGGDELNTRYYGQGVSVGNRGHVFRVQPNTGATLMNLVTHEMDEFGTNGVEQYGRETVQAPAFDLEVSFNRDTYKAGDYLEISAKAVRNNVPRMTLDTASRGLLNVLSAAIVERKIELNGEVHHNVLVKLVPPYGTCNKRTDWGRELGDSLVIEKAGWEIPVNAEPNRFAIIAWIEKTDSNPYLVPIEREVFQAKEVIIDIPLFVSDPITSVNTLSSQGIKYYPVPIRDELHLELSEMTRTNTQWSVSTLTGQWVLNGSFTTSGQEQIIDTQTLQSGVYLLQIEGYDKPIRIVKH